ncbi:MAG: class I SAM-dependent methyltransferase [Acidobacteria bacterium]|nr:class I SAM-dependent methyltransferase [Acidobacteriota bacterium]MBS1867107.1 class I SAM-dependent methyltransferase [Acidobacteriota bacterium]
MDFQYGKQYRDLYQKHWWWRAREAALVEFLRRTLQSNSQRNILDVGCGDGLFFDRLAEFGSVEGVEPDAHLISADGPHSSKIRVVPFDKEFLSSKKYGLLVMLDVLEHLEKPDEALDCAHSLLAMDGALLLTVPAFQSLWTNHDVINHHKIRYRRGTLFPLLEKAGFKVAESHYWYQWTVPAKFVIGAVQKVWPSQPDLPKIPPAWLNKILYGFTRLEQETVGAIGFPVGSTLMVYCVKG